MIHFRHEDGVCETGLNIGLGWPWIRLAWVWPRLRDRTYIRYSVRIRLHRWPFVLVGKHARINMVESFLFDHDCIIVTREMAEDAGPVAVGMLLKMTSTGKVRGALS